MSVPERFYTVRLCDGSEFKLDLASVYNYTGGNNHLFYWVRIEISPTKTVRACGTKDEMAKLINAISLYEDYIEEMKPNWCDYSYNHCEVTCSEECPWRITIGRGSNYVWEQRENNTKIYS